MRSVLYFTSALRIFSVNSCSVLNNFCDRCIKGILNLAAVSFAPEDELLLITRTTLDLIYPEREALIIARRFDPLPEAKTHKFKPNVNGILLILSKNNHNSLKNQLIYC